MLAVKQQKMVNLNILSNKPHLHTLKPNCGNGLLGQMPTVTHSGRLEAFHYLSAVAGGQLQRGQTDATRKMGGITYTTGRSISLKRVGSE